MKRHVHRTDTQHIRIGIVTMKHLRIESFSVVDIKQFFMLVFFANCA